MLSLGDLSPLGGFADPSVVWCRGRWYVFVSARNGADLHLLHSAELERGWQVHPASPVAENDATRGRCQWYGVKGGRGRCG